MSARCSRLVTALGLVGLAACRTHYSLPEFDALARTSTARTIVFEDKFSLYSPYDPITTRPYLPLIEQQRAEVFALFGVDSETPVPVQLRPDPSMGADVRAQGDGLALYGLSMNPHDGILGHAGGNVVVIAVAPEQRIELSDGRSLMSSVDASMYHDTIRHEFTHIAAALAGVRSDDWLTEGLAHAVEWIPIEGGRLAREPAPKRLLQAAQVPRESRDLGTLLSWKQGYPPEPGDSLARLLAFSFVVFLLERDPAASFRARVEHLAAASLAELRAQEPAWSAWLDELAATAPVDEPREP